MRCDAGFTAVPLQSQNFLGPASGGMLTGNHAGRRAGGLGPQQKTTHTLAVAVSGSPALPPLVRALAEASGCISSQKEWRTG